MSWLVHAMSRYNISGFFTSLENNEDKKNCDNEHEKDQCSLGFDRQTAFTFARW